MTEAFILAAGLGTRLRPLTDHRPKALVEVGGKPLLQIAIERLEEAGITHIVINIHHFADQIATFIHTHRWHSHIDLSDETNLLLDTGGGLKHAAPLFDGHGPILIHNVDILSHIDLQALVHHHLAHHHLATLCVSQRPTQRLLAFQKGQLIGRTTDSQPHANDIESLAFSGISVVNPDLLHLLPPANHPYSIIDQYITLAHHHRIGYYRHPANHWLDVGKPEALAQAQTWKLSSNK